MTNWEMPEVVAHKAFNFLAVRLSRPKTELAREYSSSVALKALTVEMAATARLIIVAALPV